jgi:hypothetical protein
MLLIVDCERRYRVAAAGMCGAPEQQPEEINK